VVWAKRRVHDQLRTWRKQPLADHRDEQVALAAALTGDQPLQIEPAQHPSTAATWPCGSERRISNPAR
jgi:hypothetical protein